MSTIIVFFMTLTQLVLFAIAYTFGYENLLNVVVIHGSPMHYISSIVHGSTMFTQHIIFPLALVFHVLKYVALARSQFAEEYPSLNYLAIIFEVIYLVICSQYI